MLAITWPSKTSFEIFARPCLSNGLHIINVPSLWCIWSSKLRYHIFNWVQFRILTRPLKQLYSEETTRELLWLDAQGCWIMQPSSRFDCCAEENKLTSKIIRDIALFLHHVKCHKSIGIEYPLRHNTSAAIIFFFSFFSVWMIFYNSHWFAYTLSKCVCKQIYFISLTKPQQTSEYIGITSKSVL